MSAPIADRLPSAATHRAAQACQQLEAAERALRIALSARSAAILELHQHGLTVRDIGELVGISHSRVAVIIRAGSVG